MWSSKSWLLVLCVLLGFGWACSGKSSGKHSAGGSGGSTGNGGTNIAAAGDLGEGGESPETVSVGGGDGSTITSTNATTGTTGGTSMGAGGTGFTTGGTSMGAGGTGFTTVTTSGAGGTSAVPGGWTCTVLAYADGTCDCGCGAPDPDCSSNDLEACEVCNSNGSCNNQACPGKIDPKDPLKCLAPPSGWTCPASAYADGSACNCGCGVLDPDCDDQTLASCQICNVLGACSKSSCPSSIAADDNTHCEIPEDWTCPDSAYGDGLCHCGCGVVDVDCSSASRDACTICWNGCSDESCPGPIDAENNAICTGVPSSWTCEERFYGDGSICNCGCGTTDPDCESGELEACDRCDFEGSCSARPCPGTIDPDDAAHCLHPTPPAGWLCPNYAYADGSICNCGCGVVDLDCRDEAIDNCEDCRACGSYSCPGKVQPDDSTSCVQTPSDWECDDYLYGDGYSCDCGCGAPDPDCDSQLKTSCNNCPTYAGSCSDYSCEEIEPEDNTRCFDSPPREWTCDRDFYGDRACDCGCGVRDPDCPSGSVTDCDFCNAAGSCSESGCPGSISEEDNAVCVTE